MSVFRIDGWVKLLCDPRQGPWGLYPSFLLEVIRIRRPIRCPLFRDSSDRLLPFVRAVVQQLYHQRFALHCPWHCQQILATHCGEIFRQLLLLLVISGDPRVDVSQRKRFHLTGSCFRHISSYRWHGTILAGKQFTLTFPKTVLGLSNPTVDDRKVTTTHFSL